MTWIIGITVILAAVLVVSRPGRGVKRTRIDLDREPSMFGRGEE